MNLRAIITAVTLTAALPYAVAEPTIFLARHAEKAEAAADTKNPDLSTAGRTRAESLGRMLRDAGVVEIFATEYSRTQQTAEEVRRSTGARVTIIPANDPAMLLEKLKAVDGNAVVIGHSNTLPEIMKALGIEQSVTIPETEYDNLFLWNRRSPRELVRLRY